MIPLFPFRPSQWSEILSWRTDLEESYDGSHQAIQVRDVPAQQFNWSCLVSELDQANALRLLEMNPLGRLRLPVWTDAQLVGPVASGSEYVAVSTQDTLFYPGQFSAVIWISPTRYELLSVAEVLPDQLTLSSPVQQNWEGGWILPVLDTQLEGSPSRSYSGRNSRVGAPSRVIQPPVPTLPAPVSQWQGEDLYLNLVALVETEAQGDLESRVEIFDPGMGGFTAYTPWSQRRSYYTLDQMPRNRVELGQLRQWLYRRCGRYRAFWIPIPEITFQVVSVLSGGSVLRVARDNLDLFSGYFPDLALRYSGSYSEVRRVTQIQHGTGWSDLTLSGSVSPDNLEVVSLLKRVRLSSDRIELSFSPSTVVKCSLRVMESWGPSEPSELVSNFVIDGGVGGLSSDYPLIVDGQQLQISSLPIYEWGLF